MAQIPSCLPGYTRKRQGAVARKQNFVYVNGYAVEHPSMPESKQGTGLDRFEKLAASKKAMAENPDKPFRPGGANSMPAWLANDRQVLQFNAFFKESVQESDSEQYRQRECTVYYYLADNSVMISEVKKENSGIPQGKFVKRHRILTKDPMTGEERPIEVSDLMIGQNLTIYGRTFHIDGCNKTTREYLTEKGFRVPEDEVRQSDQYTSKREATMARETGGDGDVFRGVKVNPMKTFMEAKLGKTRQKNLKQFLANDGKVLRFQCEWDDSSSLYGSVHKYTLHYYLADDRVEILEIHEANSGQDNFPKLMSKRKLTKNGMIPQRGDEDKAELFVNWKELRIGESLNVFGRKVKLLSCDSTTRGHYQKAGLYQPRDMPFTPKQKMVTAKVEPPPHNGFGSEEDSLGSCSALMPKPPKKNYHKMLNNDRKNLKFSAQPANDGGTKTMDPSRKFVVTYYLGDDTISVFEPQQRNSGIVGGKFLKRQRLKNSRGKFFTASDFFVGAEISLGGFKFRITDIDEFSIKYMEENRGQFPMANIEKIIMKLVQKLRNSADQLQQTFSSIDRDGSGYITMEEMEKCLKRFFSSNELTKQEILTVMRFFDEDMSGRIEYNEFTKKIMDPSVQFSSGNGAYQEVMARSQYNDLELRNQREAVQYFSERLSKDKQLRPRMLQSFRLKDTKLSNRLELAAVTEIFQKEAGLKSPNPKLIVGYFFPGAMFVDYKDFRSKLE